MGVGRREAFGVRQLAAALFLCTNNMPVPISASRGSSTDFGNADRNNCQFAGHAAIRVQNPNCEPVTLSSSRPKALPL
ncbi:MAG: hypothetical protein GX456_02270 [Verrucomicrobia bacterium]|nr:hypothetical protein [Verrucomicrobiota bacterium]